MARSTLWKHRKFRALQRLLGSRCLAAGVLECMWSHGYETAEDVLGKSAEEVEECCGWEGKGFKRGRCFDALLQTGWIDESSEGYRIHGLFEHCPQYVKRRRERHLASHKLANSYSQVSTPYPNNPYIPPETEKTVAPAKKPEPPKAPPFWSGKKLIVTHDTHAKLVSVYDERLAIAEYPKADLWLQNNPQRRRSNIGRFMANWLEKAATRAPKGGGSVDVRNSYGF